MTEQGGPYGIAIGNKIPNMPVELITPLTLSFEPNINDMEGSYEYQLIHY